MNVSVDSMRLNRKFFNRNTIVVAQELLGKVLVRQIGGKVTRARITETEAYCGIEDLACHASRGLTPRTKVMFGLPGFSYVYMIYGMYHCLNVVTREEGKPEAVLIRAAQYQILKIKNQNDKAKIKITLRGPGILCRELKIDRKLNAIDITRSDLMWLEDSEEKISKDEIKKSKRIGVDYAGRWKDKLWRFYLD